MGLKAGALLWNRMTVAFPPNGTTVEVDTGIIQENKSFDGMSPNEPGLDARTVGPVTIGSRVQVIPVSPRAAWNGIGHSEPFISAMTNTVHVTFFSAGPIPEPPFQLPPLNVLFWNPHSMASPGAADPYNPPD